MHKLLDFLFKKRHWLLFIVLEVVSLVLIYHNSAYQRNIMFSTANVVTANIVSATGSVTSYFNLRDKNKELLERNIQLEMEVLKLQDQIDMMHAETVTFDRFSTDSTRQFSYEIIRAKVINNSVTYLYNYITLNRGRKDGVLPDMGVMSDRGVVGVVSTVSDHFAVVIPLINPKFRLSCKVLGSDYFGSMRGWNGRSTRHANLDELPRHVEFQEGDTIVTSAYSALFPEGLMVGHVSSFEKQRDDNFYALQVELSTDFHRLSNVMVIKNYYQEEQKELEKEAKKND